MPIPELPDFRTGLYPQQNVFLLEENIPWSWILVADSHGSSTLKKKSVYTIFLRLLEEWVLRSQLKQMVVNRNFMVLWPENVRVCDLPFKIYPWHRLKDLSYFNEHCSWGKSWCKSVSCFLSWVLSVFNVGLLSSVHGGVVPWPWVLQCCCFCEFDKGFRICLPLMSLPACLCFFLI